MEFYLDHDKGRRRHWTLWRGNGTGPVRYPEEYAGGDQETHDNEE